MIKSFSTAEILTFLKDNPVMNIAVSMDDKPIASVLLYHVDEKFNFYITMHENSYKAKSLEKNPQISFSVWKHFEMLIQCDGVVSKVPHENIENTLTNLAISSTKIKDFWPPILSIESDSYAVYKVSPTWLRVLPLTKLAINEKETPFQTIDLKTL